MPIFEYQCDTCGHIFESIEVWSHHKATKCPECKSEVIHKLISAHIVRMDADTVKKSLPDPVPPLRELVGRKGMKGGFKELEDDYRELKDYNKTTDKNGNTVWLPKEKLNVDLGKSKTPPSKRRKIEKAGPRGEGVLPPLPRPKPNIGKGTRTK
jgi:putative FmdB family regulatory protein